MGLFGRKKKKKDENEYQWLTVDEALALSEGKRKGRNSSQDPEIIASDLADQLSNTLRIERETGYEYEAVEKHLSDIQRFEALPEKTKVKIRDIASNQISYEKKRLDYQEGIRLIPMDKYKTMDMYSDEIPEKLKTMEEQEQYLGLVKEDMSRLEGEKGSIIFEKNGAEGKKKFLIKFTKMGVFAVLAVCILLIMLSSYTGKSMLLPILVTVAAACVYAAYFVVAMKECDDTARRSDKLLNRCIELLNKVKIKYVNTSSTLDYTYEKYKCNSHQELAYNWQGYLKEKEEEKKYIKNTGLLAACKENLVELLEENGFEMADGWSCQAEVFCDGTTMRELKNVLKERHKKLKTQLEYNAKQKASIESDIKVFNVKYPGYIKI